MGDEPSEGLSPHEGQDVNTSWCCGNSRRHASLLGRPRRSTYETGRQMTASGKSVRYIRSTFVPGDSRCMCLFEASSPELVKELNDKAKLPYTQIVEAMDLTP